MNKEIKEDHWRTTVLRRLGLISDFGSRNAGKALEKLLRLPVHLEINTVDLFSPEVITKKICSRNNDKHAVSQSLYGDIPGDVCMIFPRRDALLIADLLLNRPRGETFIMAEVEASVLREVANIMTGSFLTALSIATSATHSDRNANKDQGVVNSDFTPAQPSCWLAGGTRPSCSSVQ